MFRVSNKNQNNILLVNDESENKAHYQDTFSIIDLIRHHLDDNGLKYIQDEGSSANPWLTCTRSRNRLPVFATSSPCARLFIKSSPHVCLPSAHKVSVQFRSLFAFFPLFRFCPSGLALISVLHLVTPCLHRNQRGSTPRPAESYHEAQDHLWSFRGNMVRLICIQPS